MDDVRRTAVVGVGTVLAFAPMFVIFTDWRWLIEGAGAALCVLGPALLLRVRYHPRTVQLLPGLVLLLLYSTVLYLSHYAVFGIIPGPRAWQEVGDLRTIAGQQIHDNSSPLDSTHALRTFVVPGLGVFAAVVDWYAVVRRAPALAGVPLLALFTVCGAIAGSTVGWIPFTSAAAGFLLILAADSRVDLLLWGRLVPRRAGDRSATSRLGLTGRRIGVIAVVLAVGIPAILPGLSRNLLADSFHGNGSGSGNTGGTAISPFADLKGQLTQGKAVDLARVKVEGETDPYFLRSKVLDQFTGSGWQASGKFSGSSITPALLAQALPLSGDTKKYKATVTVLALNDVAPTLGTPQTLSNLSGSWRYRVSDATLGSAKTHRGNTYSEDVVAANPTADQLNAVEAADPAMAAYTALPASLPTSVTGLVDQLTSGAVNPYERAIALFDFFRDPVNGFTYSLATKEGDSGSDLVDFLTLKTGYCQQYAGALGVMFRAAGIPARVVLGYTHTAPNADGEFTITSHDAHAWVEGYFTGIGWLPFNPTPLIGANASRNVEVGYAPVPSGTATAAPTTSATSTGPSSNSSAALPSARNGEPDVSTGGTLTSSGSTVPGWAIAVIAVIVALVVLGSILPVLRLLRRRSRFAAALHGAYLEPLWLELRAAAVDTGLVWPDSTTPRQVPAWLRSKGVPASAGLDQLAASVERERYAPGGPASDAGFSPSPSQPSAGAGATGPNRSGGAGTQLLSLTREGAVQVSDAIGWVQAASRSMRSVLSRPGRVRSAVVPLSLLERWRGRNTDAD